MAVFGSGHFSDSIEAVSGAIISEAWSTGMRERVFSLATPRIWMSLPQEICLVPVLLVILPFRQAVGLASVSRDG